MSLPAFFLVLAGVLLNAAAQVLLKAGVDRLGGAISLQFGALVRAGMALSLNPFILAGLGCYVVSVGVWLLALSRTSVSIAYPMLSIGYVVAALFAWLYLGEHLSLSRWLGIGVIILGVFLVARP